MAEQDEAYQIARQQLIDEAAAADPNNPANLETAARQRSVDRSSVLDNAVTGAVDSHAETLDRATLAYDRSPENVSRLLQKRLRAVQTKAQKELGADMAKFTKQREAGGVANELAAWGNLAVDVATNPVAILDTAVESAASMTTHAAGAKLGALAAAPIPIPGARVAGAVGGMIVASTLDAGSSKYLERIGGVLQDAGMEPTEENVALVMGNAEFMKETYKDSAIYGGTLGIVDAAFGGFFSRIASLGSRAARKAAIGTIDDIGEQAMRTAAKSEGVSVSELRTMMIDDTARATLANKSFKSKVGSKVTSYVGEVAGEPASEAAATAAAGDEIKAEDLIYETIGGIGAGPYGAAINTAVFSGKVGTDIGKGVTRGAINQTKDFIEKINRTPEQKAAAAAQKAKTAEATAISQAGAKRKIKEVVANTDPESIAVAEMSDPSNKEKYDPINAVRILSKSAEPNAIDRALDIQKGLEQIYDATMTEALEIKAMDKKDRTPEQTARYGELFKTAQQYETAYERVQNEVETMKKRGAQTASTPGKKIDPVKSSGDEIVESLGSSDRGGITPEQIKTIQARTDLTDAQQEYVGAFLAAEIQRKNIDDALSQSKSISLVSGDVYNGKRGSDFKGINHFRQAITHYLNPKVNNRPLADSNLARLKEFQDKHVTKSEKASKLFAAIEAAGATVDKNKIVHGLSPELTKLHAEMVAGGTNIHKNSGELVSVMAQEANALKLAVKESESLFKLRDDKKGTITSPKKESAPTVPKVEPAAKPETNETPVKPTTPTDEVKEMIRSYADNGRRMKEVLNSINRRGVPTDKQLGFVVARKGERTKIQEKLNALGYSNKDISILLRDTDKVPKSTTKPAPEVSNETVQQTESEVATPKPPVVADATPETTIQEEATEEVTPDVIADNLSSLDNTEFDKMSVAVLNTETGQPELRDDGTPITKPYDVVDDALKKELTAFEEMLKCCKSKLGVS